MKNRLSKSLFLMAVLFASNPVCAYDFSEENADGKTIYYNILSEDDKTCEVTWMQEGKDFNGADVEFTDYVGDINIPSTANGYKVFRIGYKAFMRCWRLTSVTIPSTVTALDQGAFYGCRGLTSVEIPNSVWLIDNFAFYRCTNLESVSIGDHVTYIGACAFYEDAKLTSIMLPNSVQTVRNQAFWGCTCVSSITLGNSLHTVGWYAFMGCSGVSSLIIPNSVTRIEDQAFSGLKGLTSVVIPKSVTYIDRNPFTSCPELTSIVVEEGNPKYNSGNGSNAIIETSTNKLIAGFKTTVIGDDITTIGASAFYHCKGLTTLEIPNSVTNIEYSAFSWCPDLESVTLPNSITSIPNSLFTGCVKLTSITIPNSVTSIGNNVFSGCSDLSEVVMGNSVQTIGESAFRGTSITSVTLPATVTSIASSAFYECKELTSVYSYITDVFETGNSAFYGCTNATLYVPHGLASTYQSMSDWRRLPIEEMLPAISLAMACTDQGKVMVNDSYSFTNDIGEVSVNDGMDNTFSFVPEDGCQLERVLINGLDVTRSVRDNRLTARILPNSKMVVVFSSTNSDINGDGVVNIADVISIVNTILNQ